MYKKLLEMYKRGRLADELLDCAVDMRWISAEQAEEIKSGGKEAENDG